MNGGKVPQHGAVRSVRRRFLTADEEQLWLAVARAARPLRPADRPASPVGRKRTGAQTAPPGKKRAVERMSATAPRPRPASTPPHPIGPAQSTRPVSPAPPPPPPLSIGRREKQGIVRGRVAIDARLDLHGLTVGEAHPALLGFLRRCQADGAKLVLVITGKGAPGAPRGERGVLRQQVPLWLGLREFRACILGFGVAHIAHGGAGALYVRLRKPRA